MPRSQEFSPQHWEGFDVRDPEDATRKIERFRKAGAGALRIEVDVDETLLPLSLWDCARSVLTPDERRRHKALAMINIPRLRLGNLAPEEARDWQQKALIPFVGKNYASLLEALANVEPRPGTCEFFNLCAAANIPVTATSASINDLVNEVVQRLGFEARTVSTRLEVVDGIITGWQKGTLTHDLNKAKMRYGTTPLLQERPYAIVLGDLVSDTALATSPEDSICIRTDGGMSSRTARGWQEYLAQSFNGEAGYPPFDAVSQNDSLFAVTSLVAHIAGHTPDMNSI